MEIKKAWEFLLLAYPCLQAFALPLCKDKQRSQPTPSDYIYIYKLYIIIYSNSWDIIYPRRRLTLHYLLYIDSNLRSLKAQNDNVRKRLSHWPALQTASLASGFPQCLDLSCHTWQDLISCKDRNYS